MKPENDEMPKAWMGYKADPKRFAVIAVCAWCPDKAAAEKLAHNAGFQVSHGICADCFQANNSKLIPDF